jgi:hypothetical protein
MTEDKSQNEKTQTIVEFQITPVQKNLVSENQDNACYEKITVTVTCNGSKLTKADSGFTEEVTQEVWAKAKMTNSEAGKYPEIDIDVHEKCDSKTTKADAGLV